MKVLFAIGSDQLSKNIADSYYDKYGESLEYKNVFYFKALLDEVKRNKSYNVIVIHEDLEQYNPKDIEQLDRQLFDYVDRITDEAQDTEIIYICSDRRTKEDKFIVRLYSIGIYNILLGDERNINPLCDIIKKPKTKREAKEYLNIDSGAISNTSVVREDEVDETQMMNILNYYDKIKDEPEKYVETFDNIASQYNTAQLKVIASWLPKNVKEIIYSEPKYKFLLTYDGKAKKDNDEDMESNISNEKTIERKHSKDFFGVFKKSKEKIMKNISNKNKDNIKIENELNNQQELAERAKKEAEEREQQELAERAKKEAEEREQQELAERAKKEAEEREQQELAERAKKEAEEREQQELAERAKKEAEEREQQELAERAKKEAEEREQQELEERAKKEAEEREQQELAERAKKEAEEREQQELAERAKKEAEEREQQELAEKLIKEAEIEEQQELVEKERKDIETSEIIVDNEINNIQTAFNESSKKEITENVISASVIGSNDISEEQKRVKEEQEKLALEQEKIRKVQAELEEEKRKLKEEREKFVNERNKLDFVKQPSERNITYETATVAPINYKKMVAFVGANKAGTTFMANAIAYELSNKKILTSILDMTRDKGMYYIYNESDKGLRKIASECMQNLSDGNDSFIPASKFLKIYTAIPGSISDIRRSYKHKSIIETVKNNCNVTIVDADFTTPIDYFEQASEIYVIQDMDILKIQETTSFLREMKNRNMDMSKIRVIVNKYSKNVLTPKRIIEGLAYYRDPEMTYTDELLSSKVKYAVVPFNVSNYIKYVESLYKGTMSFKGYSIDFMEAINEIIEQVYPQNGLAKKNKGGLFG